MKQAISLFLSCVLAVLCLVTCNRATAQPLTQFCDIVVAPQASAIARRSATDLQYHLQKIAGKAFPIVTPDKAQPDGFHFFIGSGTVPSEDTAITQLPMEGWLIKSVPGGLLLAGDDTIATRNPTALYHAMPEFLQKVCGVRWLWPGTVGEVIPVNPALDIPQINRSGVPRLKRRKQLIPSVRWWDSGIAQEFRLWAARMHQADQINANFGHAWETVLPRQTYFATHPEWYALVRGERAPRQLCTSNMAMRDEFVKRLLALPSNQKLDIVSVSANDGLGFCECDLCKAKGTTGDAYWDFVNDIAQRVEKLRPGLGVGTFAYSVGREPPAKIERLPDNVILSMTTYSARLMNPQEEKTYVDFVQSWKQKIKQWVMRESSPNHYALGMPISHPLEVSRAIEYAADSGMLGIYSEAGKWFSTNAPYDYVLSRKMWEPEADSGQILDEFYSGFGPAGPQVRAYYDLYYEAIREAWNKHKVVGFSQLTVHFRSIYSPDLLAKAEKYLSEADRLAVGDKEVQQRLAFVRTGYNYTALMAELIETYVRLHNAGLHLGFVRENVVMPTPEEKQVLLQRAWELGQQRIAMHNASRMGFALDEGLPAHADNARLRQWHRAVAKALGKPETEITPLLYTAKPGTPATTVIDDPFDTAR